MSAKKKRVSKIREISLMEVIKKLESQKPAKTNLKKTKKNKYVLIDPKGEFYL